jgi:cytochrome c biogenesis protein CcdA
MENLENNEYRRPERPEREGSNVPFMLRAAFGIFMVIIYVGMGILLLINFFQWYGDWAWTRNVVGVVLIIYGIWRAYRQVKGID